MKRQIVMPLRVIESYDRLQYGEGVKKFLQFLNDKWNLQSVDYIKSRFLVAQNLKQAYLFISFCFGGLETVDLLKGNKISEQTIGKLSQQLSRFVWNKKLTAFKMFQINAQKFGNLYPFIRKQVINNLNQDESYAIFKKIKQSIFLQGVKIRKWDFGSYRDLRRNNQKQQLKRVDGSQYLFIAANEDKTYNIGVLQEKQVEQQSRASFASVHWKQDIQLSPSNLNQNQKPQPQFQIINPTKSFTQPPTQNENNKVKSRVQSTTNALTVNSRVQPQKQQIYINQPNQWITPPIQQTIKIGDKKSNPVQFAEKQPNQNPNQQNKVNFIGPNPHQYNNSVQNDKVRSYSNQNQTHQPKNKLITFAYKQPIAHQPQQSNHYRIIQPPPKFNPQTTHQFENRENRNYQYSIQNEQPPRNNYQDQNKNKDKKNVSNSMNMAPKPPKDEIKVQVQEKDVSCCCCIM